MRLTLRTLLAYLDNTLEPKDAEALQAKLVESGFATQLVQRIRKVLVDPTLSAPSPEAVSPVDEANVISEYLDSTLSAEQIAEIEKACLESDPHLAEAAACHQILTMVLGKPADVSESLRDRIYQLPDRALADIPTAASGSFSGVALPQREDLSLDGLSGAQLSADGDGAPPLASDSVLRSSAGPVTPVGAGDSGVSDAPKRLRAAELDPDRRRRARMAAEDMYGGSIRPSRITPWLVSLGLAGVFLFVLSRVLAPLMSDPVAQQEEKIGQIVPSVMVDDPAGIDRENSEDAALASSGDGSIPAASAGKEVVVPAELAPPMQTVGTPGVEDPSVKDSAALANNTAETSDVNAASSDEIGDGSMAVELPMPKTDGSPDMIAASANGSGDSVDMASMKKDASVNGIVGGTTAAAPSDMASSEMAAKDAGGKDMAADLAAATTVGGDSVIGDAMKDGDANMDATDLVDPETGDVAMAPKDAPQDDIAVAKAISDNTILLASSTTPETFVDAQWTRVNKDMSISQRATLVNAPKFRSSFVIGTDAAVTFVGGTRANFLAAKDDTQIGGVALDYGRIVLKSKQDDVVMPVEVPGRELELRFVNAETTVAIEVRWTRRSGFDPFKPDTHVAVARIVVVEDAAGLAGEIELSSDAGQESLSGGQQWLVRGSDPAKIMDVPSALVWATDEDSEGSILDQSAREGLTELLTQDQPLWISLREATGFRRAEVAALAAQVMLQLGKADVYFGTDGILSQPKQRSYWIEHFGSLRAAIDHDAISAARVNDQIRQMDSANGNSLMRLLVGFSQSQLVEGGDEDLIEMIDSNSMAVRVLATENLREITGTTLNFWAGEENAVRRVPTIKKWQVRLRKGDIRWKAEG